MAENGIDAATDQRPFPFPETVLLAGALFLLLFQAFVRTDTFVERGDDAFYYFKVAAQHPDVSFWSFDGIHDTNGFHPLWALLLTGVAHVLALVSIDDRGTVARVFVAVTALCHFGSGVVLLHLLRKTVSRGVALAATGAWLFPVGLVWQHVWGMENSLYAFLLLSTVAYVHLRFVGAPSLGRAAVVGALLGLTVLARLDAALLVVIVLVVLLLRRGLGPLPERVRLAIITAAVAGALVVPYFAWNLATTEHLLTISSEVKDLRNTEFRDERGIDSPLSPDALRAARDVGETPVSDFIKARVTDGLWITGARFVEDEQPSRKLLLLFTVPLLLGAIVLAGPGRSWRKIRDALSRLSRFGYVAIFAVVGALFAMLWYPTELGYAAVKWWFVPSELVIVVVVATVVATAAALCFERLVAPRWRRGVAIAVIATLVGAYGIQTVRLFSGPIANRDWNRSWNVASYDASRWLADNVAPTERIGSWNAGVLGYYAEQPVVNLDGLINNFDLLPYLREHRIADYIDEENIVYLSDLEPMFELLAPQLARLDLVEVYRERSEEADRDYVIYKVER